MSLDPLTAALSLGKDLINKIWPDPAQRAEQIFNVQHLTNSITDPVWLEKL